MERQGRGLTCTQWPQVVRLKALASLFGCSCPTKLLHWPVFWAICVDGQFIDKAWWCYSAAGFQLWSWVCFLALVHCSLEVSPLECIKELVVLARFTPL